MINGLYLITDHNRDGRLLERIEAALCGGVRIVQYREKELPLEKKRRQLEQILPLCRRFGALLLVNDDPQLARESTADGVHLGQGDGSVAAARTLLGANKIVGVSTRTVAEARQAQNDGADYIGLGAMYPTGSKDDAQLVGVNRLSEVRGSVSLPIVAIGGLTRDNAGAVIDAGADSVAVISAVMEARNPQVAARELSLLFNRKSPWPRGRVLSVAGSDSGGGAGIQADLKTITLLGSYGMSAVTALTAQNTQGVCGIHAVPPKFVTQQVETVLTDIGADTAKTGMLFSAEIIRAVTAAIEKHGVPTVVDPVMIAKGGAALLQPEAVAALREELLPRAYLLTPNLPEAEALSGLPINDETGMLAAAHRLQEIGAANVLLKGGHLDGDAVDLLLDGAQLHRFSAPRLTTRNTHGTGCTLSAAIATFLAQGWPLPQAVAYAKAFVNNAIASAVPLGRGHGPINHWQGSKSYGQG